MDNKSLPSADYVVYEDMKNEVSGHEITAPADAAKNDNQNQVVRNSYWLNEIKSQEDTARQLITACIVLLGASITLFTSRPEAVFLPIKLVSNQTKNITYNNSSVMQYLPAGFQEEYFLI
jgi:hypothetical protein